MNKEEAQKELEILDIANIVTLQILEYPKMTHTVLLESEPLLEHIDVLERCLGQMFKREWWEVRHIRGLVAIFVRAGAIQMITRTKDLWKLSYIRKVSNAVRCENTRRRLSGDDAQRELEDAILSDRPVHVRSDRDRSEGR